MSVIILVTFKKTFNGLFAENGIFMFCTFLHSCSNAARNDRVFTYFSMLIFVYLHLS